MRGTSAGIRSLDGRASAGGVAAAGAQRPPPAGGSSTTSPQVEPWLRDAHQAAGAREVTALVIAWSAAEPHRVGEAAVLEDDGLPQVLGRGGARIGDSGPRVTFVRQRPAEAHACAPLEGAGLSRQHLVLTARGSTVAFERRGRAAVLVNGNACDAGVVQPGSTLAIENQLLLYCVRRTSPMPARRYGRRTGTAAGAPSPFGEPDDDGIVGESAAVWMLRDEIAFAAASPAHVLILGDSGSGKELVAHGIHRASARSARPLLARSAVSFPDALIDAELFGHARDYPSAGMPLREGLLGAADGTSLFLDEIGELPANLQAHLLRVLDAGGQYHRLGDATPRRSQFRMIAATNRPLSSLKEDFAARFALRVRVPALAERREDIPLLCNHLIASIARKSPELCARFVGTRPIGGPFYRFDPSFVDSLVRRDYPLQVRELSEILWASLRESHGPRLQMPRGAPPVATKTVAEPRVAKRSAAGLGGPRPTAEQVRAALEANGGNQSKTSRALGLGSRYALRRLLTKYRIGFKRGGPP
jgi:two-component system nitrogen regulation response regulator GlnG/two-component system response regulator HydG